MCLGRSTPTPHPRVQGKVPSLMPSSIPLNGLLLAQLYTYVLPKILQNGAKLIQKLTPGFKNHMRNLKNFRQVGESLKRRNSMGYFYTKIKFLQLKNYIQRIVLPYFHLTVHQIPYVISETISHFSRQNSSVFLSTNITYFRQKQLIKVKMFRPSTAHVKIHQIPHLIFQTKSQFFFKVWITLQRHDRQLLCTFLAETLFAIDKRSPPKCKLSDFHVFP